MKKLLIGIILIIILIIAILGYKVLKSNNEEVELIEITSKEELEKIYHGDINEISTPFKLLTLPFSIFYEGTRSYSYDDAIYRVFKRG